MKNNSANSAEAYLSGIKNAIDHIAFIRRMAETDGCDMQYIDEKMNEMCSESHDKYAGMNEAQLVIAGLTDVIKSGGIDEFIKMMADDGEE